MYCTLQEAYDVPTFDSSAKKRKSCAVQAKASADAYDPFLPENGRGETAMYQGSKKNNIEGFQSRETKLKSSTYNGLVSDYKYYNNTYGIGLPNMSSEGFQGQKDAPPPAGKCSGGAPLRYEIPLSPESKAAYDNAMQTALSQEQHQTLSPVAEPRKVDMEQVHGYYDEDLEQYLQTKDMKAAPTLINTAIEKKDLNTQPYDPESSPYAKALDVFKHDAIKTETATTQQPPKPVNPWQNIWDMLLFIFAGILIMFLCEQLFKMAMMIGMKRTIEMIEPYLLKLPSE